MTVPRRDRLYTEILGLSCAIYSHFLSMGFPAAVLSERESVHATRQARLSPIRRLTPVSQSSRPSLGAALIASARWLTGSRPGLFASDFADSRLLALYVFCLFSEKKNPFAIASSIHASTATSLISSTFASGSGSGSGSLGRLSYTPSLLATSSRLSSLLISFPLPSSLSLNLPFTTFPSVGSVRIRVDLPPQR
jgi:hypothetical protein